MAEVKITAARGANAPRLLVVLAKITGSAYHEPSAQDARRRIASFFDTHLKV